MEKKLPLIIALVISSMAIAGGGVWWYLNQDQAMFAEKKEPVVDLKKYKYVSVDKVIVMLRSEKEGAMKHYLSTDLVFKLPVEQEKTLKEQIPLLRSIAVRALSSYSFEKMGAITIDQLTADMNSAYNLTYEKNPKDKPFLEVLIGKLIVE